ncbi:MAG: NUDIX hydrolase [Gammaproteobacteria bacterium]|nr:NUDIX hydrolase [Gammaproteobacteria bacterium]
MPRVAVGAVVARPGEVLLVKRGKPPREGLWAVPGGRVNPGESLAQAAEREVREETGVTVRAGEVVHVFELIEPAGMPEPDYHYVIIDLRCDYLGGEAQAADDAREVRWFRAEELNNDAVDSETRELLARLCIPE